MVVNGANCGAEVNEASEEDAAGGNHLASEGELANEGEELSFGAGAFVVEV